MNPEYTKIHPGSVHGVGMLLKINLAPTMGRRDAAYDCAAEFAASQAGFEPVPDLQELLSAAESDTVDMLRLLSNPDTIKRERQLLNHIRRLLRLLQAEKSVGEAMADLGSRAADFPDVSLIYRSRITSLVSRSEDHLARYRAYAEKNASPVYAGRYKKSYNFYREIYQSRLTVSQNSGK